MVILKQLVNIEKSIWKHQKSGSTLKKSKHLKKWKQQIECTQYITKYVNSNQRYKDKHKNGKIPSQNILFSI